MAAISRSSPPASSQSVMPLKELLVCAVGSWNGSVGSVAGCVEPVEPTGADPEVGLTGALPVAGVAAAGVPAPRGVAGVPAAGVPAAGVVTGVFDTGVVATGVAAVEAVEGSELPVVLVATTVKVYAVPFVRPGTVALRAAPSVVVNVIPPGDDVTV